MAEESKEEILERSQNIFKRFSVFGAIMMFMALLLSNLSDNRSIEVAIFYSALLIFSVLCFGFNALIKVQKAKE